MDPQLNLESNASTQVYVLFIGLLPGMVKIFFVLVPVEDGETQHPASDGLGLLQQLV